MIEKYYFFSFRQTLNLICSTEIAFCWGIMVIPQQNKRIKFKVIKLINFIEELCWAMLRSVKKKIFLFANWT